MNSKGGVALLFLVSLSEILIIMLGAYILSNKVITKEQFFAMTAIGGVIGYFLFSILGVMISPVMIIITSIYLYLQTNRKWKSTLWILNAVIIAIISDFLTYLILLGLYNYSIISFRYDHLYNIIYSIGMLIFTVVICLRLRYVLTKFNVKQLIDKKYILFLIFGSLAVIGSLYLNIFILQGMGIEFDDIIGLLFVFILYALILLAILFVAIRITTDKLEVESERIQSKQLNEYTEKLERQYTAIKKIRHDYVNILMSMTGYVDEHDIVGLKKYIEEEILPAEKQAYFDEEQITLLMNLKIPAIKGLLASKLSLAQLNDIKVTVEISTVIDKWHVKNYDMSCILGIILDNAIEESEYCKNPEIKIGIFTEATSHVIVVENKCRPKTQHPTQLKREGFSTKGNDRGLGLSNLDEIVSKSEYMLLETTVDNEIFTQKIIILNR